MARRYKVLVADDSWDDILLLRRAFRESQNAEFLEVLTNGRQVVEYFEGKGRYKDRVAFPLPDALILDLRMPLMSGFEVLEYLQAKQLPIPKRVAILTSKALASDIHRSHQLGAHFIAPKEADFRPLVQRLERVLLD